MADSLSTKYHRRAVWGAEVASALFAAISMNRFGGAYFTYAMAVFLLFFMYDLYISWPVQRDFIPQIGSAKWAVIGVALFYGSMLIAGACHDSHSLHKAFEEYSTYIIFFIVFIKIII